MMLIIEVYLVHIEIYTTHDAVSFCDALSFMLMYSCQLLNVILV